MGEKIPDIPEPEVYEEHEFYNEEFVEIKSDGRFVVEMQYPILGMRYAEEHCMVRSGVYERLTMAARQLPDGFRIKLLDAWRPFALQKELYEIYSAQIRKNMNLESLGEEEQERIIAGFVSKPVADRELPPVHTTGGAVDVTLVDAAGKELLMGTEFDSFSPETHTAFFEDGSDVRIRDNRRLLYNIMVNAGFTNLPSEWWHYDLGDRFWAYYKNRPAIYQGVFAKEEIYEKEPEGRRGHSKKD